MESKSFAEEMARQEIRDEERERLNRRLQASVDRGKLQRNIIIAFVLYGALALPLTALILGLSWRILVWAAGH